MDVTLQIKISTLSLRYFPAILLVLIFLSSEFLPDPKKPLKLDYEVNCVYRPLTLWKWVTQCLFQCTCWSFKSSNLTTELWWGFLLVQEQCKFTSVLKMIVKRFIREKPKTSFQGMFTCWPGFCCCSGCKVWKRWSQTHGKLTWHASVSNVYWAYLLIIFSLSRFMLLRKKNHNQVNSNCTFGALYNSAFNHEVIARNKHL